MKYFIHTVVIVIICNLCCYCTQENRKNDEGNNNSSSNKSTEYYRKNDEIIVNKYPTVMIALLIRNKAHTLPYFFTYLENLNYPKDRIALWLV